MSFYQDTFKKFAVADGSEHIANEFALRGIERIVNKHKIKSVFEFGVGIGTIPYLIKSIDNNILYVGTEDNDFCINQFSKNLGDYQQNKFTHLRTINEFKDSTKFDLVIVDGMFSNEAFLKSIVHRNSIIFVEGDRKSQRKFISDTFPDALVSQCITNKRNYEWSPFETTHYIGGYTVYRLNHNSFINKVDWLSEKLQSATRYRLRKFF